MNSCIACAAALPCAFFAFSASTLSPVGNGFLELVVVHVVHAITQTLNQAGDDGAAQQRRDASLFECFIRQTTVNSGWRLGSSHLRFAST